jgi:hypothetical protein
LGAHWGTRWADFGYASLETFPSSTCPRDILLFPVVCPFKTLLGPLGRTVKNRCGGTKCTMVR